MLQREPVALGALVQLALNAVLTVLVAFNIVSLDGDQTAALYALANVAVAIVVAWKARSIVFSPATVAAAGGLVNALPDAPTPPMVPPTMPPTMPTPDMPTPPPTEGDANA